MPCINVCLLSNLRELYDNHDDDDDDADDEDEDDEDDDDVANPEDHPLCDIRRRASGVCDIRPSCFHNPIILLLLLLFIHSLSFY